MSTSNLLLPVYGLIVGMLVVGSIPGILIGVLRVPRRPLQIGLAGLLLTTSVPLR